MSATDAMVTRLRRMAAEATTETYSDDDLKTIIERYPTLDERGEKPYTYDTSTQPPTQDANEDWIPTYDLHAAAAEVWGEKAAALAGDFDFSADGSKFERSQAYEQALKQARFYLARRKPGTIRQQVEPREVEEYELVNRGEGF